MISYDKELKDLVAELQSNKTLNEDKLAELKQKIVLDRCVSNIEASILFELKDGFETTEYPKAFSDLFIDGVTSFLLYTGETQGSLDTEELVWLKDRIAEDKEFSELEKTLLKNISLRAEKLPFDFSDLMKI